MQIEKQAALSHQEKLFLITEFLELHPEAEIQDIYKWLYFGEFGEAERNAFYSSTKFVPELHVLLSEIKKESVDQETSKLLWEPMGVSARFLKVYLSPYYHRECPLKRLVNLMERSPAYRGSRMTFKLDWNHVKDVVSEMRPEFSKKQFTEFEEQINFHQLPDVSHTEFYLNKTPYAFRVISQKLFFSYFPEFVDESVFHPFDSSASFVV